MPTCSQTLIKNSWRKKMGPKFFNCTFQYLEKWRRAFSKQTSQTTKMDLLAKIVNGWKPLTIFAKPFILDVWLGSEYASDRLSKLPQGINNGFWNFEKTPFFLHIGISVKGLKAWFFYRWVLTSATLDCMGTDRHLLVQSQQLKHQNNERYLFKVNKKDISTTSLMSSWCLYC